MRFLFGLIAGALATLFVATAMDAPTQHVFDQGIDTWAETVARFSQTSVTPPIESLQADATEPGSVSSPAAVPKTGVEPAKEQEQLTNLTSVEAAIEHEPIPGLQSESETETVIDNLPATANQTLPEASEAPVWAPFHSEASARGFARHLTNQLGHPFQVRRAAPAQYLVVYRYSDETHRANLEQKIAYATGAPAP